MRGMRGCKFFTLLHLPQRCWPRRSNVSGNGGRPFQVRPRPHSRQCVGLIGTILLRRTSDHPTPLRRQGNANVWYSSPSWTHNSNSTFAGAVAIAFQGELETVVFIRNDLCRLRIITLIYLNVGEVADYDGRRRTAPRWSVRARKCQRLTVPTFTCKVRL